MLFRSKAKNKKEKLEIVKHKKATIDPSVLFESLPQEFIKIYDYIKSLSFEANPSYFQIMWFLKKIVSGKSVTDIWEWEERMITDNSLTNKQKFKTLYQGYPIEYDTFIDDLRRKYDLK